MSWPKGKHLSEEHKRKLSLSHVGKRFSKKTKSRMSKAQMCHQVSLESREKLSLAHRGKHLSEEHKRKISVATSKSIKKLYQNLEYAKRHHEAMSRLSFSPNKIELRLLAFLNKLFPSEYKFVGNGEFILGGRCPDFMNVNGQKKLIEYDGEYWHKRKRIISERAADIERKKYFAKYGYKTCIVHERELLRKDKRLESKLVKFHSKRKEVSN